MFPLRDTKRVNIFPVVTYLLILINVCVFVYQISSPDPDSFISRYALIPAKIKLTSAADFYPFFTSQFLHAGILHLVSNMWFLHIFGDNIEEALGKIKYIFTYLISGFAGAFVQYITSPAIDVPMLGASGAIAGILGAYFVYYANHKVETLVPFGFIITTVDVPAGIMLIYWFFTQLFSGFGSVVSAQVGGVAFWAHIGGFLTGYILARLFGRSTSDGAEEGEIIDIAD